MKEAATRAGDALRQLLKNVQILQIQNIEAEASSRN
jgi:hypothetical protein